MRMKLYLIYKEISCFNSVTCMRLVIVTYTKNKTVIHLVVVAALFAYLIQSAEARKQTPNVSNRKYGQTHSEWPASPSPAAANGGR